MLGGFSLAFWRNGSA